MTELLLVDADTRRRLDVWDRLVGEGYRVVLASIAHEAVERALGGGIDLIVLDVTAARSWFELEADHSTALSALHALRRPFCGVMTFLVLQRSLREAVPGPCAAGGRGGQGERCRQERMHRPGQPAWPED